MKKLLIITSLIFLAGCKEAEEPTNEEILKAAYELNYAGLREDCGNNYQAFLKRLIFTGYRDEYIEAARDSEEVVERAKQL